ncbi:hypothetical protein EIN_165400 [Entamoeba invadens IP1]|uniref:HMG box domain-containing protein n=1 Tax=Entamoeba invadens IP1 TaxID=370355 RepID=A0A0A1U4I0_ENTIV|nr:hypothetical protein EIN_165400 [Entamoeba invadens IP1]ELP89070.1 hypothetical protein EIN_165400 [Entamoeba invadens IP1]|eukprot:XP_004255841.1 hypothetical protein EIN_165400 [Entamoeba invadens IP1]
MKRQKGQPFIFDYLRGAKLDLPFEVMSGGVSDKKINKTTKAEPKKKLPKNPYLRFSQEKRAEVKEANPSLAPKDITKKIADLWKALSAEEKDAYKPKKRTFPGRKGAKKDEEKKETTTEKKEEDEKKE